MHKTGDKIGTFTLTRYLGKSKWLLTCDCGKTRITHICNVQHAICCCQKRIRIGRNKRASGLQYKNTPERLQELRENIRKGAQKGRLKNGLTLSFNPERRVVHPKAYRRQ